MHLLYLDASGTDRQNDMTTQHYVLVGVGMPEAAWFELARGVSELKRKYAFPGSDPDAFELHVKQFAVQYEEQRDVPDVETLSWEDRRRKTLEARRARLAAAPNGEAKEARRKKYRGSAPYIHLSRRERSQLLEDAVDLVSSYRSVRLFGEAVSKKHPAVVEGRVSPVREAFTQVVSRFDRMLQNIAGPRFQGDTTRRFAHHGLLILDQDPTSEEMIEGLFRHFRDHGHPFGMLSRVIDVPFFAPSVKVGGLQVADVVAYVVRRYFDKEAKPGSHEDAQFVKLFQGFDRDGSGRLHGLRHYVPANSCHCRVCVERGHGAPFVDPARG